MEIHQIIYVQTVAHYRNFSKAAMHLNITQPTLSQQIGRLEAEIGFPLFERTTRVVNLTDQGRAFLEYAEPLIQAYDNLNRRIETIRNSGFNDLSIGVLPTFHQLNLLDIIHHFQSTENISVNMQIHNSNNLIDLLLKNQIDAAIANIFPEHLQALQNRVNADIVSTDIIHVVLSPKNPLAAKEFLTLQDLNHKNIIMLSKSSSIRMHMDQAFVNSEIIPAKIFECPVIHSMIGMISADQGCGFLSSRVAAQYISSSIVSRPLTPEIRSNTAVIYLKNSLKAEVIQKFSAFIKAQVPAE